MKTDVINMFKELELLFEVKKNIELALGKMSVVIGSTMSKIIAETKYNDIDCFAMLSVLMDSSKKIESNIFCVDMNTKEKLRVETYLDILYCLEAHSKRKFKEADVLKCKEMIQKKSNLTPYFKDLALLCLEVENIMHNFDLASYRQYKKYFCNRIG